MYTKLYVSMFEGTLTSRGPWQALVVFQNLLILADPQGVVDMTADAIVRRTTLPMEVVTTGLEALERPDPDSRSPAEQGRRIVRLSDQRNWGWRIVNFLHYRDMRTQEDRRSYMAAYQRKRRAKKRGASTPVNKRKQPYAQLANAVRSTKTKTQFKTVADRPLQPGRGKGNGEKPFLPSGKVNTGDQASASAHQGSNPAQQEKANGQTLETWAEANGITRSGRETEDAYRRRCIDAFVKSKAAQSAGGV